MSEIPYVTTEQRDAAYDFIMAQNESSRCMTYLILEKFNWRVPDDNLSYAFKAYELAEGTSMGEKSARFIMDLPEGTAIWEFFMLMTNYW